MSPSGPSYPVTSKSDRSGSEQWGDPRSKWGGCKASLLSMCLSPYQQYLGLFPDMTVSRNGVQRKGRRGKRGKLNTEDLEEPRMTLNCSTSCKIGVRQGHCLAGKTGVNVREREKI